MISSDKTVTLDCWTNFHDRHWYSSYISSLMSSFMFERWFSALLVRIVRSKMLWKSLHWNVFLMFNWVFFSKFFKCSMFIKSFRRLQHSSKNVATKFSAFCSYEKKKLVIRWKDKGYRLRKQKSKNGCRISHCLV